jgi:hypothetical protein
VENWHDHIGDPTIADAILDRLIHNAHRFQLKGGSMRKKGGAITVPQVQTMYTSPGVSPNDINKSTHATSAQSKSDAEFDKLAMQGGKRRKRGGNPDWLWGCYSGGKKRKTRTNKRKTRKYRKKTRRNKK